MKTSIISSLVAVAILSLPAGAQTPPPVEALDGVDTVLLLQTGKETFGKSAFKSQHGRFTYLFASAETKAEFDASPERYSIQMNGACARMGTGTGNQSNYAVVDGKIYIFASDDCHKLFVATPARFIPPAAAPMSTDTAAISKGKSLLDRAAQAHGGAKLDAVAAYAETYTVPVAGMANPPSVATTWRYPDGVRVERTFQVGERKMTVVTLLAEGGGWTGPVDAPQLSPLNPIALPGLQLQLRRMVVPLLRARNAPGTRVAALPSSTVDGVPVDRVRMVREGLDVTLNIDQASGRVHSTAAIDRGPESAFGEVIAVFGDFRDVDGILVPYSERTRFDGRADASLDRTIQAAKVNPAVDPAQFRPGAR